jgi:hypothetical protein
MPRTASSPSFRDCSLAPHLMFDGHPSSDVWNRLARARLQGIDCAAAGRLHERTDLLDRAVSVKHGEEGATELVSAKIRATASFRLREGAFFLGYLPNKDLEQRPAQLRPIDLHRRIRGAVCSRGKLKRPSDRHTMPTCALGVTCDARCD